MRSLSFFALTMLLGPPAVPDVRVSPVEITEWKVPWENTGPRDPYVDGQGRIWFVGQRGHYLAYLQPKSGEFKRYELEPGTGPHNLIVDAAGFVWYAGNRKAHIGRMDPRDGSITKYPMPDAAAKDPHTLVFDRQGDIWFTVQGGNFVGKLATKTGKVELVSVPTPNARPYGIVIDSNNRPWFNEFGTNKIGTVDANMRLREIALPHAESRTRRIGITSDQMVWFVDYSRGFVGRLDPATGKTEEWAAPSGARSLPYAMAIDGRDRIWFAETGVQPNRLVGFDPKTREFFSVTEIKSGGGSVRHMVFHKPTSELWFGTDANTIGRAKVPG